MVSEYVNVDTLNNGIPINAGVTCVQLEGSCGYRNVGAWRTLWRRVSEVVRLYRSSQGLRIDGTKSCAARAVMMTNSSRSRGHYYNVSIGEVEEDSSTFGLHLGHQASTIYMINHGLAGYREHRIHTGTCTWLLRYVAVSCQLVDHPPGVLLPYRVASLMQSRLSTQLWLGQRWRRVCSVAPPVRWMDTIGDSHQSSTGDNS
ncbi:hypothetical protein EDD17DRAFT_1062846 [Pisolithus thermaeus]|nr:hypothetical protein EDD17DRAFT_1062846 [Pisolithus thermaeus]